MKASFPGYFKLKSEEIAALWGKALFVFDANVILNLYRYSETTRTQFLAIFERLKERIWLPHQAVQEYLDNRLEAIGSQEKAYDDAIKSLNEVESLFRNPIQPPFITEESLKKLSSCFNIVKEELEVSKEIHAKDILDDGVLNQLSELFGGCIGKCFTSTDITGICKEGEGRYKDKTPPGFKDSGKVDEGKNIRKYGDLIIWKEILRKAKDSKCDVLLITDDKKEDWWLRFKGKTISPRPELIREFQSETGKKFHMYQSDRFLEYAVGYLKLDKSDATPAIEELKSIKKQDADRQMQVNRSFLEREKIASLLMELRRKRTFLSEEIKMSSQKRDMIEDELKYITARIAREKISNFSGAERRKLEELHHLKGMIEHASQGPYRELKQVESEITRLESYCEEMGLNWNDFDNLSRTR